jgi:hypothetical protein
MPFPVMTEIDTIRILDDIFVRLAEADGRDVPLDDAVETMWAALESGALRLVVDGKQLRVEPVDRPPAKRLLVACENWPNVAARRRVLYGLYEAQPPGR